MGYAAPLPRKFAVHEKGKNSFIGAIRHAARTGRFNSDLEQGRFNLVTNEKQGLLPLGARSEFNGFAKTKEVIYFCQNRLFDEKQTVRVSNQ